MGAIARATGDTWATPAQGDPGVRVDLGLSAGRSFLCPPNLVPSIAGTGLPMARGWLLLGRERDSKSRGSTHVVQGIDESERESRKAPTSAGISTRSFSLGARQENGLDTGAARRQDLFTDAPHGQDASGERDLAGHRQVGLNGLIAKQADQGGGDRHARGRAVLGDCASRDVNVQVGLGEST